MNKDRRLLRNLYLLAKHHAKLNRGLSNDLIRREDDPVQSGKDFGRADAYDAIVFYLTRPEILSDMDYNKIFQETESVPNWLQESNTATSRLDLSSTHVSITNRYTKNEQHLT